MALISFVPISQVPAADPAGQEKAAVRVATNFHFEARFDGYHPRATKGYSGTIPAIRPTTRYAFVTVTKVHGGNWRPDVGMGMSIAIDEKDLRDEDGNPLEEGHIYECQLREVLEAEVDTYITKFVRKSMVN